MKKHWICSSLATLMIYLLLCGPNYASEHKTTELNRKMAEISSLQQSLSKKISLAMQKQEQLKQKVDELGEEINHLIPILSNTINVDLIFLIDKQFLVREKWEEGLRMMGQKGNWDQFEKRVVADRTIRSLPKELIR